MRLLWPSSDDTKYFEYDGDKCLLNDNQPAMLKLFRFPQASKPIAAGEIRLCFSGPYIVLHLQRERGRLSEVYSFPTDDKSIPGLVEFLDNHPIVRDHPFFIGLKHCYSDEAYDAFDIWFRWFLGETTCDVIPTLFSGDIYPSDAYFQDKPQFSNAINPFKTGTNLDISGNENLREPDEKKIEIRQYLENVWSLFLEARYSNGVKLKPLEALAVALAKVHGEHENFSGARFIVQKTNEHPVKGFYLKQSAHAIDFAIKGDAVPLRLQKFIGNDNGYLRDFTCDLPFKRADLVETGEVNLCCGHLTDKAIGRVEDSENNFLDILNTDAAQSLRKSMVDGSYKYCNHLECHLLAENKIARKDEVQHPLARQAIDHSKFDVDSIDEFLFSYDQSCNLSCPSCRVERIVEKPSENQHKADLIEKQIVPLLSKIKNLHINVAGEIFVSKPSRKILKLVSKETTPQLKLQIISNGMLFNEKNWNEFQNMHGLVESVRVSVDAVKPETFEALRRLAIYDVFAENMAFLSELRKDGKIRALNVSFTYQLENYDEMADFIDWGQSLGVDKVIFEPLQNVGAFTDDQYRKLAVHKPDHDNYGSFIAAVKIAQQRAEEKNVALQSDFSNYQG